MIEIVLTPDNVCSDEETPEVPEPIQLDTDIPLNIPTPLGVDIDIQTLHQPQGPKSGVSAFFGKWPGDETDEEIDSLLKELS